MKTVTVREVVFGDGKPKICIPITAETIGELHVQIARALEGPCDLIELRVDFMKDAVQEQVLLEALEIVRNEAGERPLLFTFRTAEEGGEAPITLEEYRELNLRAAKSGRVDLIDIEYNRGREFAGQLISGIQKCGVRAVCSYHNFRMTPETEKITEILCAMQEIGADITKAAVMPENSRDVLRLLDASVCMKEQLADRPYITMSMSTLGSISRLAGSFDGSCVTFATAGRASAPGQLAASALAEILPSLEN